MGGGESTIERGCINWSDSYAMEEFMRNGNVQLERQWSIGRICGRRRSRYYISAIWKC